MPEPVPCLLADSHLYLHVAFVRVPVLSRISTATASRSAAIAGAPKGVVTSRALISVPPGSRGRQERLGQSGGLDHVSRSESQRYCPGTVGV